MTQLEQARKTSGSNGRADYLKGLEQEKYIPEDVITEYANLEWMIRQEVNARSGHVCAVCTDTCCSGTYCREALISPFLLVVNSRYNRFNPPPDWKSTKRPFAVGKGGCVISIGKSKLCTEFTCQDVLAVWSDSDVRQFAYRCLSTTLMWVSERFHDNIDIDDLLDFSEVTDKQWDRLRHRIEVGRGLAETALWFLDGPPEDADPQVVAERLLVLSKRFPQCMRKSRRG